LLTARERDVLVLLAEGLSNVEIGTRMYLGTGTVKDHVGPSAVFGLKRRIPAPSTVREERGVSG
jgi:DNA-binding CsgD family transcriptional regulator